jgi:hypothetical protein
VRFLNYVGLLQEGLTQKRLKIEQKEGIKEEKLFFERVELKRVWREWTINRNVDSGMKGLTFFLLNLLY